VQVNELHSTPAYDPYNALVYAARASDVLWTMIAGRICYDVRLGRRLEERFPRIDLAPVRAQVSIAAQKNA